MGNLNSCFARLHKKFGTLHTPSSFTKLKHDCIESINYKTNQININDASEDELLFLPGITRQLAQNIVEYRETHNGFKDLIQVLNVKGIHYDLLKTICFDIRTDSLSLDNKQELINLNSASYDELSSIPGLKPNLVTRIMEYRVHKGLFRFLEDLLQIKGIDCVILSMISPYVTVHRTQTISINDSSVNYVYSTLDQNNNNNNNNNDTDRSSLASLLLETLPSELEEILRSSLPPPQHSIMIDKRKPESFRFASWNLQELTNDKAQSPGVREVICRIILENNFSLIGIQEIGNKESLDYIIQELNNPTIPVIKNCLNRYDRRWKCTISDVSGPIFQGCEYLGFIYDESAGIELKQASLLPLKTCSTRSPYISMFRLNNKIDFVFVNIHLQGRNLDEDETLSLSVFAEAMKDIVEHKHVVIFGDFNLIPTASEFEALNKYNYSYVIQQNTNICLKTPQGSTCMDNIWLSADVKTLSTGNSGVIRDNLTSVWIPNGWTWGGLVSDHCPIWIEFDLS